MSPDCHRCQGVAEIVLTQQRKLHLTQNLIAFPNTGCGAISMIIHGIYTVVSTDIPPQAIAYRGFESRSHGLTINAPHYRFTVFGKRLEDGYHFFERLIVVWMIQLNIGNHTNLRSKLG